MGSRPPAGFLPSFFFTEFSLLARYRNNDEFINPSCIIYLEIDNPKKNLSILIGARRFPYPGGSRPHGFCRTLFYWVLPGFTGFPLIATGFKWVSLGFTVFYWVIIGSTGFYLVLMGFTW